MVAECLPSVWAPRKENDATAVVQRSRSMPFYEAIGKEMENMQMLHIVQQRTRNTGML